MSYDGNILDLFSTMINLLYDLNSKIEVGKEHENDIAYNDI